MLLRYYDRAGIEAEFDLVTNNLRLRPSDDFGRLLREAEGTFTLLGGTVLVLITTKAGVQLRAGSRQGPLNDAEVTLAGHDGDRVLEIRWSSGDVYRLGYTVTGWIESDPTPGVEREDFDFGLFLQNVRYDSERQRRMCGLADD